MGCAPKPGNFYHSLSLYIFPTPAVWYLIALASFFEQYILENSVELSISQKHPEFAPASLTGQADNLNVIRHYYKSIHFNSFISFHKLKTTHDYVFYFIIIKKRRCFHSNIVAVKKCG